MGLVKLEMCGQMSKGSYDSIKYRIPDKVRELRANNQPIESGLLAIGLLLKSGKEVYLDGNDLLLLQRYDII